MTEIIKQIGIFLGYDPDGKSKQKKAGKHDAFAVFYATAEWLITAFAVTLIFIVFFMQAYTIPTGSMADTLKGAHFRLRCEECGHHYDYGYMPEAYQKPSNYAPRQSVRILPSLPRCPSCGYYSTSGEEMPVVKGDRIFVAKCLYQFSEPKRWDAIVFKNPTEPRINYIKRLIGKPGEEIEIIDGDIYIDGLLARKPEKVQQELWMPIYENDFQPANPSVRAFNGHTWHQPFVNTQNSKWNLNANGPTIFALDSDTNSVHTLRYDITKGNDFKATYAYNEPRRFDRLMPVCSDLMIQFYIMDADFTGKIGAVLGKYGTKYFASIDSTGKMEIIKSTATGQNESLIEKQIDISKQEYRHFKFSNVDHLLTLFFGKESIQFDLGKKPEDAGERNTNISPEALVFGSGKMSIGHIGLFRDIHYLSKQYMSNDPVRAGEGNPFKLGEDEFFACGDNSPNSADSRLWTIPGKANSGKEYPMGVLPRDYLVGKAFFVYWPGGHKPNNKSRIQLIPHIQGMKRIYGGTE